VGLVRVNSQIVNGVVTYIAQIDVDNKKLLLYPGMSADANIITRVVKHKFIVPRAALLYIPIKPVDKKMASRLKCMLRFMETVILKQLSFQIS